MLQFGEEAREAIKELLEVYQRLPALDDLDEDDSDAEDEDEDEVGVFPLYTFIFGSKIDSNYCIRMARMRKKRIPMPKPKLMKPKKTVTIYI